MLFFSVLLSVVKAYVIGLWGVLILERNAFFLLDLETLRIVRIIRNVMFGEWVIGLRWELFCIFFVLSFNNVIIVLGIIII